MLLYIAISIMKPASVVSVPQDLYNVLLKSNSHYTIDEAIGEDDYEMKHENQKIAFSNDNEFNQLMELDKFASKQHRKSRNKVGHKKAKYHHYVIPTQAYNYSAFFTTTTVLSAQTSHSPRKRDLSNIGTDYNYDELLNEYYMQNIDEAKSKNVYQLSKGKHWAILLAECDTSETGIFNAVHTLFDLNRNCTKQEIGIRAIKCILLDYQTQKQPVGILLARLWGIVWCWFMLYLFVAIPLWCTRGLCCCCLCCQFFKPYRTIEEAKKYYVMNPPGLMKTTKAHEILYEPSKSERESYEEFEHLIRTI